MFGCDPVKVRPGYAKFDLENAPLNFTLNEKEFNGPGALSHLGFQVATVEEVESTRARWIEAGLYTKDEIETDCCYALQTKTWVYDPDGNEWEVFAVLADDTEKPAAVECCASPLVPLTR